MRKFFALVITVLSLQFLGHALEAEAQYDATWTRSTWSLSYPESGPYFRTWMEMLHDPVIGKSVLFGGSLGFYANDIWHYDAAADRWTEIITQQHSVGMTPPCGRDEHTFVYDPYNRLYWSYGGSGYACDTIKSTAQPGSTTVQVVDTTLPATTVDAYKDYLFIVDSYIPQFITYVDAYDPATKTLTLKLPAASSLAGYAYRMKPQGGGGTWYFDPTTNEWGSFDGPFWGYTGPNPRSRLSPAFAFSSQDNAMVMFGGDQWNDTWKLDVTHDDLDGDEAEWRPDVATRDDSTHPVDGLRPGQ